MANDLYIQWFYLAESFIASKISFFILLISFLISARISCFMFSRSLAELPPCPTLLDAAAMFSCPVREGFLFLWNFGEPVPLRLPLVVAVRVFSLSQGLGTVPLTASLAWDVEVGVGEGLAFSSLVLFCLALSRFCSSSIWSTMAGPAGFASVAGGSLDFFSCLFFSWSARLRPPAAGAGLCDGGGGGGGGGIPAPGGAGGPPGGAGGAGGAEVPNEGGAEEGGAGGAIGGAGGAGGAAGGAGAA